jgi:iron complex transport system ATP-binding protein
VETTLMLLADNLSVSEPGRTLVKNFSHEFNPGEFWAVLGKNGSGKSSLLHVLSGVVSPAGGRTELNRQAMSDYSPPERAKRIGLLLQEEPTVFWGTLSDYVMLGRFPHGDNDYALAQQAIKQLSLAPLATRKLTSLSGGERQRARIAQLLCQSPDVYCLDEPLLHLDVAHQAQVMKLSRDLAKNHNKTVIMVMHEPIWTLRFCTHALLLSDDAQISCGEVAAQLTRAKLQKLYDCDTDTLAGFGIL